MKVLIVAKTRIGNGACIGGISFEGQSVRLVAANAATNEQAGMEYAVGDVWKVEAAPARELVPPHTENVIVHERRRLGPMSDPLPFIERFMPPRPGGIEALYDGLLQATPGGVLYITARTGIPPYSTMFWRPAETLTRADDAKRIRYRYPTPDGGRTLTFVGFQEPLTEIPAGAVVRVSLAHWWRPEANPDVEYRCFLQLSGWFLPRRLTAVSAPGLPSAAVPPLSPDAAPPGAGAATPPNHGVRPLRATAQGSDVDPQASLRLLKSVFGYDSFRPLQAEIIRCIGQRKDTLVVMPTGGGKSLCYQLPALLFSGLTVVVSPLIALMQDQVDQLHELGVSAAFLNSTLDYSRYLAATAAIRQGEVKLLYVSPETLLRPETLLLLDQCAVDCLTIDEAHCISSWGHDFRPEYRQLLAVRRRYPQAVCVALTATATARVRDDIQTILGFDRGHEFVASFDRPNLYLAAQPRVDGLRQVLDFLAQHADESGIIYCSTRQQVDTLAAQLNGHGYRTLPYHAGLDDNTRRGNQRRFVRDETPIMVATIAFGMGINKSNVRFIVHHNLPENIESYYQQIGRAGRDGLRADCLLLVGRQDIGTIARFIEQGAASERPGKQARLQALLRFVETSDCRRLPLLDYFGEAAAQPTCAMCDRCLSQAAPAAQTDVTEAARQFLAAVVQTGQRFGVMHIIHVLRGSQAQPVLNARHHQLSVYGSGKDLAVSEWRSLAQQFITQGLAAQDMQFGSLTLTALGDEVLQDRRAVSVAQAAASIQAPAAAPPHDEVLFQKLREVRRRLADAANLPPYIIFSDRTLLEMATYYPQSAARLLDISGVGQVKLQKYGEAFLVVLRAHCAALGLPEQPRPADPPVVVSSINGNRRFEEVGELFASGHTIAQLQGLYGVQKSTILSHLYDYLRAGHAIDPAPVLAASSLAPAQQAQVMEQMALLGPQRLAPIYDACGQTIPYEELHLLRVVFLAAQLA